MRPRPRRLGERGGRSQTREGGFHCSRVAGGLDLRRRRGQLGYAGTTLALTAEAMHTLRSSSICLSRTAALSI